VKLERNQTVLVVIDVQSKLLPVIYDYPALVENIKKVIQGAQILGIPVVLTEQYPEGLGLTVDEIRETLSEYNPIEKMSFSCCGEENFIEKIKQLNRNKILVCGIEAHVCIYQTCMDLLSEGYEVHLLVDAISSRKKENRDLTVEKLHIGGVQITSVEMALFEILKEASVNEFRKISKIIK